MEDIEGVGDADGEAEGVEVDAGGGVAVHAADVDGELLLIKTQTSSSPVKVNEPYLGELMKQGLALGVSLEVVVGSAPGWAEPWARAFPVRVVQGERPWEQYLVDEQGMVVRGEEIQLARLATTVH